MPSRINRDATSVGHPFPQAPGFTPGESDLIRGKPALLKTRTRRTAVSLRQRLRTQSPSGRLRRPTERE